MTSGVKRWSGASRAAGQRAVSEFVPRYYQIYAMIQQRLRDGEWSPDHPMPTEQEFADSFRVSRVTVRKALNMLEEERLIVRQQGRGTFASRPARRRARTDLSGLLENMADFEQNTRVRVLSFGYVPLPEEQAALLELPTGTSALRIERVRSDSSSPFSHTICYVPTPEAELVELESLGNRTVIRVLEDAGVKVTDAEQRLGAVAASVDIAELLKLPGGAPLIAMTRVVRNDKARPVELLYTLYRPDRFEYRVNLSRDRGSSAPRWTATA